MAGENGPHVSDKIHRIQIETVIGPAPFRISSTGAPGAPASGGKIRCSSTRALLYLFHGHSPSPFSRGMLSAGSLAGEAHRLLTSIQPRSAGSSMISRYALDVVGPENVAVSHEFRVVKLGQAMAILPLHEIRVETPHGKRRRRRRR